MDRIDRRLLTQPLIPGTLALASTVIAMQKSEGGPLAIASFFLTGWPEGDRETFGSILGSDINVIAPSLNVASTRTCIERPDSRAPLPIGKR